MQKEVKLGTIRVKARNLKPYEKTKRGWRRIKRSFLELTQVAKLFKAHNNYQILIDTKQPQFLKGQLSKEGQEQGARINILPTGEKLEKAFSLFSPHLKIHDQDSHDHWDVIYQNKGGTYSYVYTLEKRRKHRDKKYKKVDLFERNYAKLTKNLQKSQDITSLAIKTLLKTYMRVGNEVYFRSHGHKGLTTLMKKDVSINNNIVTFKYVGKDGVPIQIQQKFSNKYIRQLQDLLKQRKRSQFVFAKNNKPLRDSEFKKTFKQHCGHEFYPHIVRSHHATMKAKIFLKNKRKVTKREMEDLFFSIAHDLQHKKFNKKTGKWQDHYAVTVNSYIQPSLVEKIKSKIK